MHDKKLIADYLQNYMYRRSNSQVLAVVIEKGVPAPKVRDSNSDKTIGSGYLELSENRSIRIVSLVVRANFPKDYSRLGINAVTI